MQRPFERQNQTKFFRDAQKWALRGLMMCVPMLLILLGLEFFTNPNPVPAVITIAGLVLLCFFFAYVFVAPDDFSLSATDRTLGIASKIFTYTRHGLTPEATLGACQIILPETLASAICVTDGSAVVACWGEDSDRCPAGTPVVLGSTLRVLQSKHMEVFAREAPAPGEPRFFPRLHAGITAPLIVRDRCMGTIELYYPRYSDIDARQTALATGFAELISTQLASFELERQQDVSARMELRALQSQVDPHFLFNTIGTIVSLVRTEPEKARSLLIDFSNYYRQTLSNSDALTSLQNELGQGMRYINLMHARDRAALDRPFLGGDGRRRADRGGGRRHWHVAGDDRSPVRRQARDGVAGWRGGGSRRRQASRCPHHGGRLHQARGRVGARQRAHAHPFLFWRGIGYSG